MSANAALPRRTYQGDVTISAVGFGGILLVGLDPQAANAAVREAVEAGVDYFDVAPTYGKGEAEERLGPALEPFRDDAFLACKTTQRDAAGAQRELDQSLKRLRTDHVDLYQFHGVASDEDVEQILAPGGAAETFHRARQAGKARFLGLSAHDEAAAIRLMDALELNSVLLPINFVCAGEGGFGPRTIEAARDRGVARLALKGMAYTPWAPDEERTWRKCWYRPVDDPQLIGKAVRWTLSHDITAMLPPGHLELFRLAVEAARNFTPMDPAEQAELQATAEGVEPIFRS